ncbi:MAG TPA: M20/M25/M40 family metallo-hydrolase [Acidimicrobiales bacterium]|nr:M20/M25/M40 family metallo-hydrolase [Acidimicrobiales bacterium]
MPFAETTARLWEDEILPALTEYIAIPSLSPAFEPDWAAKGHMADAVELVRAWCAARPIDGLTVEVHELDGRTPVIVVEVPASGAGGAADDTVLLYGHLDKQPPMTGWLDGLGPWTPVRRAERLYGRGGADDGYAAFASLAAIEAVRAEGASHARCVLLIEASEESGSPDLPAHVEALAPRLGSPSLVVCLDSGCATFDRLWATTSLRGLAGVTVTVRVLTEGVHSGAAGGMVPSSFRLLRQLLERVEDARTGAVLLPELHAEIPPDRVAELTATATELGNGGATFPFVSDVVASHAGDPAAQLLARTWRPALAYIGADGLPPTGQAGNVLRPATTLGLSFRLPPTVDPKIATDAIERALTADPPQGAQVTIERDHAAAGWAAPAFAPWLERALEEASRAAWGQPARTIGEGGSIPFMGMLGERFPAAQFVVTGVLGPGTNAHGPNEYLHVPYATALTGAVAHLLAAHAGR